MRGLSSSTLLALTGSCLLTLSTARADTFQAPTQVMAQANGSFSYACVFRKTEGTDQLAGYGWGGNQNVNGGLIADCFCFCRTLAPGDSVRFDVTGSLVDPTLSGQVGESISLCNSPGGYASTLILPFDPAGVGGTPVTERPLWNEPNPFSDRTTFHYLVPVAGPVTLSVYDLAGRQVAQVVDEVLPAGPRVAVWTFADHENLAGGRGVLFARLSAGGQNITRALIRVR